MEKKIRIIETTINAFSKDGFGLGSFLHPNGSTEAVEVPFAIPGDRVEAALFKRRRGVFQSQLVQIVEPAPDRIPPRCIHFGTCGGCRWQQFPYDLQLREKEQRIRRHLQSHLNESVEFYPIIPCNPPWGYRNKVELSFSSDKAQNRYLGFMIAGSRGKVFQLEQCHLVPAWMNEAVTAVKEWWLNSRLDAYHLFKNTGSLRTLTLRDGKRSGDRMVILTVSGNPEYALHQEELKALVAKMREAVEPVDGGMLSIFIRIQQIAKGTPTNFYEMHLYGPDHIREIMSIPLADGTKKTLTFQISPAAFFQPNTAQAERLYTRVLEMVEIPEGALVYDLYCGTGTLGICLASRGGEVVGIELTPESVIDAKENIKLNGLTNVEIRQGDVGKVLPKLLEEKGKRPDVVVVDPPRAGLDGKAIEYLIEANASVIVYVSCNPATQAANLEALVGAGYRLESVQPVDQFPHTVHVENIVVLRK